jgi:hypothetical protein
MPSNKDVSNYIDEKCSHLFDAVWLDLQTRGSNDPVPVLCGIVVDIIEAIEAWGVDMHSLKVGVDAGGGTLKVTIQSISEPELSNSTSATLLVFVGDCIETRENLDAVLNHPNIKPVWGLGGVFVAADFKVLWMLLGLSQGGRYPCPFCTWSVEEGVYSTNIGALEKRTTSFHSDWHSWYCTNFKSNPKFALQCYNCINPPIISFANAVWPIMPPSLHLFLGVGNQLLSDMINNVYDVQDRENLVSYITQLSGVVKPNYWANKAFEGPSLRVVLNHVNDVEVKRLVGYSNSYRLALSSFDRLVSSLFGVSRDDDWVERLEDFCEDLCGTGRQLTVKMHVVVHHLRQFIDEMSPLYDSTSSKVGLGRFSEQALESSHHRWSGIWSRAKHIGAKDPRSILKAITEFNCSLFGDGSSEAGDDE